MTMTIDAIKTKIEKLTEKFGGQGNVALTGQAYHGCYPDRPYGWNAPAIQIDGNLLHTGTAQWDFDDFEEQCERDGIEIDDASMYPWDNEFDFVVRDTYELDDDDDLETIESIFDNINKR